MTTTRIVLTVPFIRLAAGTVLELDAALGVSGWDDDERVRERRSFHQRHYALPDGGNGVAYELDLSDTMPCPEALFADIDISTGPCRVTAASFSTDKTALLREMPGLSTGISLSDLVELAGDKQSFRLPEILFENAPEKISLIDRLHGEIIRELPSRSRECDFTGLGPGFYQISIEYPGKRGAYIRIIKSFPLILVFEGGGKYSVMETLY